MKNNFTVLKTFKTTFLIFLTVTLLSEPVFSASKKKKAKNASPVEEAVEAPSSESTGKLIKLNTTTKKKTYFYKIDPVILQYVENGSPESIRQAMTLIRKNESEYTENEKVLIQVATDIMKLAYPSEKITWNTYEITEPNTYTGAINSVKNGVYDTSTGNVDVLSTILPNLLLLHAKPSEDILTLCEASINEALVYSPESVLVNYIAGVYFDQKGMYSASEIFLHKAYEGCGGNQEISLEYARILNLNNKLEDAEKVLLSLSESDPDNLQMLKQKAYIAYDKGDYSQAEEYVARVLQQTPNNLEFVLFRAKILIAKNDYIHAVSLLDMYSRQDDTSLEYLLLRTKVQLEWSKKTSAATATIEKALTLYTANEEALLLAARISAQTDAPVAGKYSDELAAMVLQSDPNNAEALRYSLDGLVQRQNWNEAYAISSKLSASSDCPPEVMLSHVIVCLNLGKTQEAIDRSTEMYKNAPEDELALQAYIIASTEVMSNAEAIKLIDSLLTTNSPKLKSYLYYRRSFFENSEETALADLRSSLTSNPRNSDSLFRMYEIYFQKQEYRKAQYYLRQVVSINPNDNSVRKLNEALTQLIQ